MKKDLILLSRIFPYKLDFRFFLILKGIRYGAVNCIEADTRTAIML